MIELIIRIAKKFSTRIEYPTSFSCLDDERRTRHVIGTHACTIAGALIFIPIHLFVSDLPLGALFNTICIALCLLSLVDLWFRGNLNQTLWITVLLPSVLVISLFWLFQGRAQISAFLIIPPGFAFLLLGRRHGTLFGLGYGLTIVAIVLFHLKSWPEFAYTPAAMINMMGALVLALFWGFIGERIRGETFQTIETIAETDVLTDSINRRHFFEEVLRVHKITRYQSSSFAMMMMDIDSFKSINDQYGHDMGDKVLIELVHMLKGQIRSGDIIGRLGGDEFGLLFPNITVQEAVGRAKNICQQVDNYQFISSDGQHVPVTISIGVAMFLPGNSLTAEQIYKTADQQLYRAKQAGKNQVAVSDGV
ncbi:GGDEF domain-containing protein [Limnobaculum xujianqingii]|uniref:GGDEF domain-containing protein n=1 Tax=Limnobaculum xujianqingii TaxID=2738837 RepID=UPI001129D70C|nr:GGDEF domain-containing protein [Limnobaculum xujianqingii]